MLSYLRIYDKFVPYVKLEINTLKNFISRLNFSTKLTRQILNVASIQRVL